MEHDWKSRCRRKLKRLLKTCSGRVTKEIPPSRRSGLPTDSRNHIRDEFSSNLLG